MRYWNEGIMKGFWRQWLLGFNLVAPIIISIIILQLPVLCSAEVYLSTEAATKKIFPTLQRFEKKDFAIEGQRVKVLTVYEAEKIIGWAVVTDEMGKARPITFLVGIGPKGEVLGIYVLEYREMFGSEIKRRSFLRQFQGKSLKSSLKIGQDIDAVTQATISSHAATLAVRRSLKIIEDLQKNG